MKTLVVVPGGGLFLQLNALAKDRYPGAMVVSYGTALAGHRFDKIVAVIHWREDASSRRFVDDWIEQYLPTKMPPGGKVETIGLDEFVGNV